MKPSKTFFFAVTLLASVLAGCAFSIQPLYIGNDLVSEPGLVGKWLGKNQEAECFQIVIVKGDRDNYIATSSGTTETPKQEYDIHLVRLEKDLFADVFFKGEVLQNDLGEGTPGTVPLHMFARISINGDTLKYSYLAQEKLEQQLVAKKISIAHQNVDGNRTVFTAPTSDLQTLLQRLSDSPDAFSSPDEMHRQKSK
jgi:hypothetical protein